MLLRMPGNQRRHLKTQKLNTEISYLCQTPHGRGKVHAGVGIQRLKGTCFGLFSALQLKTSAGPLKKVSVGEMQRASIHTNVRQGKERQEMTGFAHHPEELTAISVFLCFPTGLLFRLHRALEDPQEPPFTLTAEPCVSLDVAMIPFSAAAVISVLLG